MKKTMVLALLAIAAFAALSLVRGASYLEAPLPGGLPFGNVLSALLPCAVAAAAVLLGSPGTVSRALSVGSLVAALGWLPVSIALAGNLALDFSGWRGSLWVVYTIVVAVAALGSLIWALVASLVAMRGRAGAVRQSARADARLK